MTINRCGSKQSLVVRGVLLVLLGGGGFLLPLNAYAQTTEAKLDALEAKADATTSAIAALETKGDAVETKVDALATNVSALEAKLDAIEAKIDQLAARPLGAPASSSVMLAALVGLLTIMGLTQLRRRTRALPGAQ